jgi:hypothetical protein
MARQRPGRTRISSAPPSGDCAARVLGAFAGPGTAAGGAAIGALTGFTSTTAGCIVAKLGDLAGAW